MFPLNYSFKCSLCLLLSIFTFYLHACFYVLSSALKIQLLSKIWAQPVCVFVCVFLPCRCLTNKLTRLPSVPSLLTDLCTWFCPLSSDSTGCSLDCLWQITVKQFDWRWEVNQPSISCLDFLFGPFDISKNKWSVICSWFLLDLLLLACRNNTVPLCSYASDFILSCWVFNYTKSWNMMDSSVGMIFRNENCFWVYTSCNIWGQIILERWIIIRLI